MVQATARASAAPGSARKARLVLDLIRGKHAADAIFILQNTNRRAAAVAEKVLRSAIANAQTRALEEARRIDEDDLVVVKAAADDGPSQMRARGGRRTRIRRIKRRTTHYTISVASTDDEGSR